MKFVEARWWRFFSISVMLLCTLTWAYGADLDENKIKAAYLYNFAKFTRWSEEVLPKSDSEITFCVYHDDAIFEELAKVKQRPIKEHPLIVLKPETSNQLKGCLILYLGKDPLMSTPALDALKRAGSLIITEEPRSATISFVKNENKLSFIVDLNEIIGMPITLSSELIKLAFEVRGKPEERMP